MAYTLVGFADDAAAVPVARDPAACFALQAATLERLTIYVLHSKEGV